MSKNIELAREDAVRLYAAICTGSYVPSMFGEVRELMKLLDAKIVEVKDESPE